MENFMKDHGRRTRCMDKEFCNGMMERDMKETFSMISVRDRVLSFGRMEENTLANGKQ